MRHSEYSLEDIRTFFAERIYETLDTQVPIRNSQMTTYSNNWYQPGPSTSTYPYPTGPRMQQDTQKSKITTQIPRSSPVLRQPTSNQQLIQSVSSVRPVKLPKTLYLRVYNPLVPILEGPRVPPPVTPIYSGSQPHAAGNKCIGCGMSGHNTYGCPFGNILLGYTYKRFGYTSMQCRLEWVPDLPEDAPLPRTHPPIPNNPNPMPPLQLLTIEEPPQSKSTDLPQEQGTIIHISSLTGSAPPTDVFLLDSGASSHIVRDVSLLSSFTLNE